MVGAGLAGSHTVVSILPMTCPAGRGHVDKGPFQHAGDVLSVVSTSD